jgi:hypothetical protein
MHKHPAILMADIFHSRLVEAPDFSPGKKILFQNGASALVAMRLIHNMGYACTKIRKDLSHNSVAMRKNVLKAITVLDTI